MMGRYVNKNSYPKFDYIDEFDRYWLAGILDGEGCFRLQKVKTGKLYPRIILGMTDEDIIIKVSEIFKTKYLIRKRKGVKDSFVIAANGSRAINIMREVFPLLCTRRKRKIIEIISGCDNDYLIKLKSMGRIKSNCWIIESGTTKLMNL